MRKSDIAVGINRLRCKKSMINHKAGILPSKFELVSLLVISKGNFSRKMSRFDRQSETGNGFVISHYLLQAAGLDLYSKGTEGFHYPFVVSFPFWAAALWIGKRYISDYGSAAGYRLGQLMVALSMVAVVLFLIFQ